MTTVRIQIEKGLIEDSYIRWGFIYNDSDTYFAPPEKKREKTSYAEEAGVHEDPRTVYDEFDYNVSFIVEAANKNAVNVNSKIKAWNNAVRESVKVGEGGDGSGGVDGSGGGDGSGGVDGSGGGDGSEVVVKSDIMRCKTITLYDDYKRCKIVGIPEIISKVGKDDFFRRKDGSSMDCVIINLTIHVSNPNLCEFDINNDDLNSSQYD